MHPRSRQFGPSTFAWWVLAYNLLVIAWGAYVRASGSGAGCGRHWPLCNGVVVPSAPSTATIIEATHRATSGLALLLVLGLTIWTLRAKPRFSKPARRAASLSTVFVIGEALIGAGLVLFELVAHDASMKRGLSMILHLGNTFLLLGALVLTAWLTRDRDASADEAPAAKPGAIVRLATLGSLVAVLVLGASGAVAALGDTLFPARSLKEGLAQDLSPLAHLFLRLRVLHPFLALGTTALVFATASLARVARPTPRVKLLSRAVTMVFATQFAAGILNLFLLAPVPMQIVHLLLADASWLTLVLLAWETLYAPAQAPIMSRKGPAPISDVPPSTSSVEPVT
ncbi:MAG: COX15/CtaA family protein [Labilithrix sp.]|nr:COX15/CtaA family protein [Labilithrix sp.]